MGIKINDVKKGNLVRFENNGPIYQITEINHIFQGRGGAHFEVMTRMIFDNGKPLKDRGIVRMRKNSGEKVDIIFVDEKKFIFMYSAGEKLIFMDQETFDEISVDRSVFDPLDGLITDGMELVLVICEGTVLSAKFPKSIEVDVTYAEASIKNQTASSSYKPAEVLDGKIKVQVPVFVNAGDRIIINTEDFSYISRAD